MKISTLVTLLLFSSLVFAYCETEECFYNPKPHGDLSLPMLGGFDMVFKKVQVPDKNYLAKNEFNFETYNLVRK